MDVKFVVRHVKFSPWTKTPTDIWLFSAMGMVKTAIHFQVKQLTSSAVFWHKLSAPALVGSNIKGHVSMQIFTLSPIQCYDIHLKTFFAFYCLETTCKVLCKVPQKQDRNVR